MANTKKQRKTILSQIIESVKIGPKTIYELSKELGSNWDTIKSNVDLLSDLKVISIQEQKVVYNNQNIGFSQDTFAGLPVSNNTKAKVYYIAKLVLDSWKEITDKPLSKTKLQKALVEIADAYPELKIPRGWYMFGKVVLIKVDPKQLSKTEYEYNLKAIIKNQKELLSKIKNIVSEYAKKSTHEVVHQQYNKYDFKLYLQKQKIEDMLLSQNIKQSRDSIAKDLYELLFLFDLNKQDDLSVEIFSHLKGIITIMIQKIYDDCLDENRMKIQLIELFNSVWRIVSTYYLLSTLEGELGYDYAVIRAYFEEKIHLHEREIMDQIEAFASCEEDCSAV